MNIMIERNSLLFFIILFILNVPLRTVGSVPLRTVGNVPVINNQLISVCGQDCALNKTLCLSGTDSCTSCTFYPSALITNFTVALNNDIFQSFTDSSQLIGLGLSIPFGNCNTEFSFFNNTAIPGGFGSRASICTYNPNNEKIVANCTTLYIPLIVASKSKTVCACAKNCTGCFTISYVPNNSWLCSQPSFTTINQNSSCDQN
jgi:hypothetical protein